MNQITLSRSFVTGSLLSLALCAGIALAGCVAASEPTDGEELAAGASAIVTAPTITALNVTGSPPEGGKTVLIVGSGFQDGASVTYDGIPALSVTTDPASGGLVTVTPPHPTGFVDVVVTNPDGGSATRSGFHYGPPPVVTSFSPTYVRKGDSVIIDGTDFASDLGVQVGIGGGIAKILSKSPTELVVTVPKLNQGSYQLWVANFDSQYSVAPGVITVH